MIQISTLRKRQRQNLLLAFLLSLAVVLGAYALLGFLPFGDGTLLTGDLNGLYVNYITDMWRRVRQGGFGYSFSKLAGGSTLGLFAYYMNSPFNLLYLLFPSIPRGKSACSACCISSGSGPQAPGPAACPGGSACSPFRARWAQGWPPSCWYPPCWKSRRAKAACLPWPSR